MTTNLIPAIDENYVPFGCYDVVRKVISNKKKIWAPVWIAGESGNGKTMGVTQACAVEKRELIIINISNETTEDDLIGSYVLEKGEMIWKDGPVLTAMKRGAVLCLDEIDQARTSIMALNTIAQGHAYYVKKTNELIYPADGFMLIGTANTKGLGDGADRFIGAQTMNEAFIERFAIFVEQEYPPKEVEVNILSKLSDDSEYVNTLVDMANSIRESRDEGEIDFLLSTRRLVHIINNFNIFGDGRQALIHAIARFNSEDQAVILELFDALSNTEVEDIKHGPRVTEFPPEGADAETILKWMESVAHM